MTDKPEGKAKGGFARADALLPEERKRIARKAAKARWAAGTDPVATHIGELKIGELLLPCAVLPDGTRVISQGGVTTAFGPVLGGYQLRLRKRPEHDGDLPTILTAASLKPFISEDLRTLVSKPRNYRDPRGGPIRIGLEATLLPKVCEVWLQAKDAKALTKIQLPVAERASILMRALAHTGIIALVDEATGYQDVRPKEALQAYLEAIIRKELAAWAKRFPDEFYENIYKLRNWPWPGMAKNRYSVVAHYTRDLVYERLAPGVLEELERKSPKDDKGYRLNKLHQWLTDDVGHPLLAQHLHSLLMFQRLAIANGYGWNRFVKMVDQVLPKKGSTLELALNEPDGT